MTPWRAPLAGATHVGRYRLLRKLASGGMAAVFLASLDTQGGVTRWVAVKLAHPHLSEHRRFVEMFLQEARVASRIDHPQVCAVLEYGESPQGAFIVMEYLHGQPLSAVLKRRERGALTPMVIARIVADAARGLHAAHELRDAHDEPLGVVHQDVSPQNILVLYEGGTKVVDFGVARCNEALSDETRTEELKGKAAYMAPEQFRGRAIDRRVDVFALGVVLWEALTGVRLFKRENDLATMAAVIAGEVPPPSTVSERCPAELDAIVLRALAAEPADRFPSAEAFADALEVWLAAQGRPAGSAQVAQWMKATFATEMADADQALRVGRATLESLSPVAPGEEFSNTAAPTVTDARAPRRPLRSLLGVPLVAALALAVGLQLGARRERATAGRTPSAPTVTTNAPQPPEPAAPLAAPAVVTQAIAPPSLGAPSLVEPYSTPGDGRVGRRADAGAPAAGTRSPARRPPQERGPAGLMTRYE
jgi:tRNA A-37 threonylcarbamoyl transferase component Bud32